MTTHESSDTVILLRAMIKKLEEIEDNPKTMLFISRRLGALCKSMKDLLHDLQTVEEAITPERLEQLRKERAARHI